MKLVSSIRDTLVLGKNAVSILGLVVSSALVGQGVVDVLADFLGDKNYPFWKATMLVNFLDGLSAVLTLAVIHVSEAYTGRFKAIIFCTTAYTMGLVLLWIRASHLDIVSLIFAIVLIALGTAGKEPTLRDFFDYQLREKVKKNCTEKNEGEDKESSQEKARSDTGDNRTTNLWWSAASIIGSGIAVMCLGSVWSKTFEVSSLIMGATCLLFILGIFWYYPEEKPPGSPLIAIYRVFRAAIKKRKLSYPSSEQGYNNEGSKDSEDSLYERENDKVLLLPRDPSFLSFLDKAAIKNANEEQACTAEQVRDVKSLYVIMPLGLIFSMYILVSASGNTYFILQTSNLDSRVGSLNFPTPVFFVLKSLTAFGVQTIQSRYKLKRPLCSMAVGMFCSGLCCIAAWQVERRRLSLVKFLEKPDDDIPMSIMILIPQYFLLGLMKEFGEGGLQTFLRDRVHSEPMKKFMGPCIEMLMGIGKWSSILLAWIFHRWIKDSINHSRLDKYFLVLALLSFVYLGIYVLYAKFKLQKPLVIPETSEGINVVCYQLSCEVNSV